MRSHSSLSNTKEHKRKIMLQIKLATPDDYNNIKQFYYNLIDAMEHAEFTPGWEKDIYPSQELLTSALHKNTLYMGKENNQIISCMIVNQEYNEGYRKVNWTIPASDSELMVIHALGVHPAFANRGIAKQMVQKAIGIAKEQHCKTIRLDVLSGNLPAEKAYLKMGFHYIDTLQMYYEDTGWTDYKVYELIL